MIAIAIAYVLVALGALALVALMGNVNHLERDE